MAKPKSVNIKSWYTPGGDMMYNTECLPITHAMHPYNQILAKGLKPEDYGIEHPHVIEFEDKSRSELVAEILSLREELDCWMRGGI